MPNFNDARLRVLADRPVNPGGRYVLYWMQNARRLRANHALDHALHWCRELKKPLVLYEGLKLDYPWASARPHTFVLEGMRDNAAAAKKLGITYWPFVETPGNDGRGLVRKLLADACVLITDDYPAFMTPAHNRATAAVSPVRMIGVEGCGVIPLSLLGPPVAAAAHLRPRIHKLFAAAWDHRAAADPDVPKVAKSSIPPPFDVWTIPKDVPAFVRSLPVDATVPPVAGAEGGSGAGRDRLARFVEEKLPRYAEGRNLPDDPAETAASGLSAHLHFGHLGIQEVCEAVLGRDWTTKEINPKTRNKDDFFCRDPNVNGFLDEAITWRDIGHHWHWGRSAECEMRNADWKNVSWGAEGRPSFNFETMDFSPRVRGTLESTLPAWALATLGKHAGDRRDHLYSLEQFEAAETHDPLWNTAQRELVATGRMHNYLRMLWGKKVLEWSATPEEAYRVLEFLNNKYALDGRDPNSYTGILWCFGLFDRPWPPEREVFGSIRFMSSENTARKFKLAGYYDYVSRLPTVAEVRAGKTSVRAAGLF